MKPQISALMDFLAIPSVSSETEFAPDCAKARDFLASQFSELGLSVQILPAQIHNAIFAATPHHPGQPTVLIYGHYDVQPTGSESDWTTPAFEPHIREKQIYARGASDDKSQVMIHVMAAKQLISKFGLKNLPVNLKFIIEGEEEIGSPSVENLLSQYPQLFQADYVIISDTEMASPNHPSIDISLRGVMDVELEIQTGSHDLHSGQFGGLAPNPAFLLANILAKLKNGQGRVCIPGFYRDVLPLTNQEVVDFDSLEPSAKNILEEGDFYFLGGGDPDISVNRRRWSEPTLDITGIESGYTGTGTKTIIPNTALAKLSMRIVPNQDHHEIYRQLINFLQLHIPKRACMRVFMHPVALPYKAPTKDPVYSFTRKILDKTFGNQTVFTGQGGSIGFIPVLSQTLNVPCILIGFGLPDENIHAPNEHFSLENYEKGISAMTIFYSKISDILPRSGKQSLTKKSKINTITKS